METGGSVISFNGMALIDRVAPIFGDTRNLVPIGSQGKQSHLKFPLYYLAQHIMKRMGNKWH